MHQSENKSLSYNLGVGELERGERKKKRNEWDGIDRSSVEGKE